MKVLVIEDDRTVGQFVKRGLEEQFNQVDLVDDGVVALQRASASEYDVLVLDLRRRTRRLVHPTQLRPHGLESFGHGRNGRPRRKRGHNKHHLGTRVLGRGIQRSELGVDTVGGTPPLDRDHAGHRGNGGHVAGDQPPEGRQVGHDLGACSGQGASQLAGHTAIDNDNPKLGLRIV